MIRLAMHSLDLKIKGVEWRSDVYQEDRTEKEQEAVRGHEFVGQEAQSRFFQEELSTRGLRRQGNGRKEKADNHLKYGTWHV